MKKVKILILIALILFASILNFLPHIIYSYPLHVDEWVHYQFSGHMNGDNKLYFGGSAYNLELGFHFILSALNFIGIPYIFMFRFFPALLTAILCFSVFILTKKIFNEDAALFSVLFIALLKSNVSLLGPMFLVPMSVGLILITLGIYLLEVKSKLFFLPLAALLLIHPPSALAYFLIININTLFNKKEIRNRVVLQIFAFIIALPLYIPLLFNKGLGAVDSLQFTIISGPLYIPRFIGYFSLIFICFGIYELSMKKRYDFIVYILSFIILIGLFYFAKIEYFIPYRRALMYLFLLLSIVFGAGCWKVANLVGKKKAIAVIAIVIAVLFIFLQLPSKMQSTGEVYHIINENEAKNIENIRNLNISGIVIADPWKANAITPLSGKEVYTRIVQGPNETIEKKNEIAKNFLEEGCKNNTFLDENDISVVYYEICNNNFLTEIYDNVFVYKLRVERVIDGDTFVLNTGEKVRLICIDAPELGKKGGEEAKEFLKRLIEGKEVVLEKDISERDAYGRLLRYVYVMEGNETIFVNKELVKRGQAEIFRYGNDTKRCDEIAS